MNDSISIEKISPKLDTDVWTAIGDLCCRTGNGGEPIDRERWELFGPNLDRTLSKAFTGLVLRRVSRSACDWLFDWLP